MRSRDFLVGVFVLYVLYALPMKALVVNEEHLSGWFGLGMLVSLGAMGVAFARWRDDDSR